MFKVRQIDTFRLSKIVNIAMLKKGNPDGWYRHLENYVNGDMVVDEVLSKQGSCTHMKSVVLKLLVSQSKIGYYIRPGQLLGEVKFQSEKLKDIF